MLTFFRKKKQFETPLHVVNLKRIAVWVYVAYLNNRDIAKNYWMFFTQV